MVLLCRTVAGRLRRRKRTLEYTSNKEISRNDTTPGVPDVLYYLPEGRGGKPDLLHSVPDDKISYVESQLIEKQEANEHFEYFQYVMDSLDLEKPTHWREGLQLYHKLVSVSVSGA